ncbi:MAG: stage III sporulation protein AA [Halanaerobiales bacterium]|nr:stage III sporulation protein AA [Halanaerobiales bacterium]
MNQKMFQEEIVKFLPKRLRACFMTLEDTELSNLQEIRLRVGRPMNLIFDDADSFLGKSGLCFDPTNGEIILEDDIGQTILFLCNHSMYALDEELRQGFITISGGHRVGFVGRGVIKDGMIHRIKEFSGINFRITREVKGCADRIIPYLIKEKKDIHNTLIVSPPRCGKTTMLRDLIRQLSNGYSSIPGFKIGVVDERSEIGGSFQGIFRHDLGIRTDLLDHCPKSEGMYLLIRSMSPEVIATDEIGSAQDVAAIQEAANAGIRLITTVHGRDLEELLKRPVLKKLLKNNIFTRIVFLSHREGAGTIEKIFDENLSNIPLSVNYLDVKERVFYG